MIKMFSILFLLLLFSCAPRTYPISSTPTPTTPVSAPAPQEGAGEKVIQEARKEGKVVVYSAFGADTMSVLQKAFKEKYGVVAEFLSGRDAELAQKILTERKADLHLVDIFQGSAAIMLTVLKPARALDPLEPSLILTEVVNPKMWLGGRLDSLEFFDRDRTIFSYFAYAFPPIIFNTNQLKPEEIKSYREFLTPRWKGKIIMTDPTTPGAASYWFAATLEIMGIDFMREFVKQEPVIVEDRRLQVEWVAHGKYSVGVAAQSDIVAHFQKEAAPIKRHIPAEGTFRTSGGGNVGLINRAPHPNAAKLFLNWLLGQEAQTYHSKTALQLSARVDVPIEHLDPLNFIQPGVKYVNTNEDFLLGHAEKLKMAREIFGPGAK